MLQLLDCGNNNSHNHNDAASNNNLPNTNITTSSLCSSSMDSVKPSSSCIRISVSDSGAGISVENQKKMFGQYVQFNAAQLQKGKGSGLGLWISKSKYILLLQRVPLFLSLRYV